MNRVFRLAILEAEVPTRTIRAARGTYGDIFTRFFANAVPGISAHYGAVDLRVTTWDVMERQRYPHLGDVDGILIGGSACNAFDDDPWIQKLMDYVMRFFNTRKPILGIGFGHQIIARVLGGQVARNPRGWEIAVRRIELTSEGRGILRFPFLDLPQFHQDTVVRLPSGLRNLGDTEKCDTQVFYRRGRVLSFQGHPEYDPFIMKELLLIPDLLSPREIRDCLDRAEEPHDGPTLATRMVEFLLDSSQA